MDPTGIESRLGSLEIVVAGMRRDLAHMYGDVVEGHIRVDQLTVRVERIERRLELSDAQISKPHIHSEIIVPVLRVS